MSVPGTTSDLRAFGWRAAQVARRPAATSEAVRVVLAGAALTDILVRLFARSRAALKRPARATDIEERLRDFEQAWEQSTGERLTTAAFYDRFCSGEFDTRFGARWATYYEATLAHPASRDGLSHLGLHRRTRLTGV